jgi:hypothetical protein
VQGDPTRYLPAVGHTGARAERAEIVLQRAGIPGLPCSWVAEEEVAGIDGVGVQVVEERPAKPLRLGWDGECAPAPLRLWGPSLPAALNAAVAAIGAAPPAILNAARGLRVVCGERGIGFTLGGVPMLRLFFMLGVCKLAHVLFSVNSAAHNRRWTSKPPPTS